jgi:hypothetical protein
MAASKRESARHTVIRSVQDARTIDGFCFRQHISRSSYINYRNSGDGPAETRAVPGGRVIITAEAEAAWVKQHTESEDALKLRRDKAEAEKARKRQRAAPALTTTAAG